MIYYVDRGGGDSNSLVTIVMNIIIKSSTVKIIQNQSRCQLHTSISRSSGQSS